ncbi:hypothetical protein QE250_06695 [Chromatiaceae bacterium AAb-1]|nr:hypothetical protein [Chromatiaceae bacterium AAb-1]
MTSKSNGYNAENALIKKILKNNKVIDSTEWGGSESKWQVRWNLLLLPVLSMAIGLSVLTCIVRLGLDFTHQSYLLSTYWLYLVVIGLSAIASVYVFRQRGQVFPARRDKTGYFLKWFACISIASIIYMIPVWISYELQRPVVIESVHGVDDWRKYQLIEPSKRNFWLEALEHKSIQRVTRKRDTFITKEMYWIPMTAEGNVVLKTVYQGSIANSASTQEKQKLILKVAEEAKQEVAAMNFKDAHYYAVSFEGIDTSGKRAVLFARYEAYEGLLNEQRLMVIWVIGLNVLLWLVIAFLSKPNAEIYNRYQQKQLTSKYF